MDAGVARDGRGGGEESAGGKRLKSGTVPAAIFFYRFGSPSPLPRLLFAAKIRSLPVKPSNPPPQRTHAITVPPGWVRKGGVGLGGQGWAGVARGGLGWSRAGRGRGYDCRKKKGKQAPLRIISGFRL